MLQTKNFKQNYDNYPSADQSALVSLDLDEVNSMIGGEIMGSI